MSARDRRRALPAMAAVVGIVVAACGGSADNGAQNSAQNSAENTDAADASGQDESSTGEVLPASAFDGTATTVTGESYELSQLAGTDVVLWFWAPW